MITVKQLLVSARAVQARGWTQHRYARDRHGRAVHWASPVACRFCPLGSLKRACDGLKEDPNGSRFHRSAALLLIAMHQDEGCASSLVHHINDALPPSPHASKARVLRFFDLAIASA